MSTKAGFGKNHNRKVLEKQLDQVIGKICRRLDISPAEWDIDGSLYRAIRTSRKLHSIEKLSESYDAIHTIAKEMNIEIATKYSWLVRLTNQDTTH